MVFSSTSFLFVFLPVFLLAYVLLPGKNAVALCFSLLFFAWGEGAYLLLLLATIAINYWIGAVLDRDRPVLLGLGVAADLMILGYFKYFGFVVGDLLGIPVSGEQVPHLPLGISFFIFQSISYLVDVYRGQAPKARSFLDLALYIAMFPQLIAGPIVRYGTVAASLVERTVNLYDVHRGVLLFSLGLAYKTLIANNVAEVADQAFALPAASLNAATAWVGIASYTLQIFFDFAGYSLMAIGLGRIMGFHFPRNFDHPYISQSITEFWRRWHISLSSWFRDYLYIPLGGNRSGPLRTYRNLLLVFLLCGLWHGAAWTFVFWGLFHGALLMLERAGLARVLARLPRLVRHGYTLLLVMVGWVLFRADDAAYAAAFLARMFLPAEGPGPAVAEIMTRENLSMGLLGCVLLLPCLERTRFFAFDDRATYGALEFAFGAMLALALIAVCSVYVMSGTYNPFIYFRF